MARHLEQNPWTRRAETMLGVALAVTPVTLWVAWTLSVFLVVVGVAVISAALLVLLHGRTGSSEDGRAMLQQEWSRPALPSGFVEEIHRLFPLTYHHSRMETPRFRRAMQKLRRMMR